MKEHLTADLVRSYLQEMGRFPLLTAEQEITYARQVQQMIAIEQQRQALANQLKREPTEEELAAVAGKTEAEVLSILHQGQRAKEKMLTANLRLVVTIAKKYQNRNMEFLDLLQEGTIGLNRGIEKFDPSKGYKLSTYIYWWIKQGMTRAISEKSRTVRIPIHISESLNKIKTAQRELSQSLGRYPSVIEVAQSLKLKPEQVREYLRLSRQPLSLEKRVGDDSDRELGEMLPDMGALPEEHLERELQRQNLTDLLACLKPVQRQVLSWRFGLEDGQELTLAQIGDRLNVSRERVRQIEYKAMSTLRRQQKDSGGYL
jgi:RNA polymerase nonessential primary-like sigma factor